MLKVLREWVRRLKTTLFCPQAPSTTLSPSRRSPAAREIGDKPRRSQLDSFVGFHGVLRQAIMTEMTDPDPKPRWYRLTPDRLVIGAFWSWNACSGCQSGFSGRSGIRAIRCMIAVAMVGLAFLLMLLWFIAVCSSGGDSNSRFGRCWLWSWSAPSPVVGWPWR